jgi:carboxylesterase type B
MLTLTAVLLAAAATVEIDGTTVTGVRAAKVVRYLGIRYATPADGRNRAGSKPRYKGNRLAQTVRKRSTHKALGPGHRSSLRLA